MGDASKQCEGAAVVPLAARYGSIAASAGPSRGCQPSLTPYAVVLCLLRVLQEVFKSYGLLALGVYFSTYFAILGTTWALVYNGSVKGPNLTEWLNKHESVKNVLAKVTRTDEVVLHPLLESYLVAWLITKTTEPARVIMTVMVVPSMVRWLPLRWLRLLRVRIPKRRLKAESEAAAKAGTKATGGGGGRAFSTAANWRAVAASGRPVGWVRPAGQLNRANVVQHHVAAGALRASLRAKQPAR